MRKNYRKIIGLALALVLSFAAVFVGRPVEVRAEEKITISFSGDTDKLEEIQKDGQHYSINNSIAIINGSVDSTEKNQITFVSQFGYQFTAIVIDGVDYSSSISSASSKDQVTISLSGANSYKIDVRIGSSSEKTIIWRYAPIGNGSQDDAYVDHGKVVVRSVAGVPQDPDSQHIVAHENDIIIVELKPDYGYQIAGVSINGGATLEAQADTSQFKFKMPGVPIHFRGIFKPSSDQVENKALAVVSGGNIANGNVIAQSGNAKVTFSDAETNVTGTIPLQAGETRDTSKNVQSINITTEEIVSKGESNQYWTNPKTVTTGGEAEISLTVNQKATGYAVIRTHGSENKEIPSTYDPDSGKLTFGSDRFSTYTLVPLTTSKNDYVIRYPQGSGNSSILQENGGKQEGGHSHQFEWKTITTPTAEMDGLEAYACIICGYYTDSVPVSAYSYACTEGAKQVLAAGQNAEITLKMGRWCSYPRWFMEKLAQRRDQTVHLQFEYLHKQYEVLIPAKMPMDTECEWYGPLKLCNLYPYTIK